MGILLSVHLVRGSFSRAFKCICPSTNLPPTTNIHFVHFFFIFCLLLLSVFFSFHSILFFLLFFNILQLPTLVTVYPVTLVASFRPM
ncbi:hypothetical protein KSS87_010137, partial [Heliosperma pusillum]